MIHRLLAIVVFPLIIVCSVNGCGKNQVKLAPVSGKVLFQGKPLNTGAIMFHPENGPIAYAAIQPDGTFNLTTYASGDGAVLGKHHIRILCTQPSVQGKEGEPVDDMAGPGVSLIPVKYSQLHTSGLTAEVMPTTPSVIIDLK